MQSTAGHRRNPHPRSGFTWIDVAVVLAIILTLAALFLPATRNAREAAMRVNCQNHMKQLCTGLMNYASKENGELPWLSTVSSEGMGSNWIIDLMPELDAAGLRREWNSLTPEGRAGFRISLKFLQCVADPTSFQVDGGLSYVANSGFGHFTIDPKTNGVYETKPQGQGSVDWDGDGEVSKLDRSKTIATGVFGPQREGDAFRSSLDYIKSGDGQTNTILLAENLYAGKWNSTQTLDIAFVVGLDRIQFANPPSSNHCLQIASANLGPYGVAGGKIPRHTPSPSSNHEGTSIYGFAGGAARQISDKLDPLVYLRLMTPNGQRFGEALDGLVNY